MENLTVPDDEGLAILADNWRERLGPYTDALAIDYFTEQEKGEYYLR